MYSIKKISFETIRDYWLEVGHFHVANKVITEQVIELGPYKSHYEWGEQQTQAYGLFDKNYMIGGTQILEWQPDVIRCRAYNIRTEYRNNNLFYKFLSTIVASDWSKKQLLVSWFRSSMMKWALKNNFELYDGTSYNHDEDTYTMTKKLITELVNDFNDNQWNVNYLNSN